MKTRSVIMCRTHPDRKLLECGDCGTSYDERQAEYEIREAMAEAHVECDNAFPIRFRAARVDAPEVADWLKQYRVSPKDSTSLLLMGPVGTGKTYQGYAALRGVATTVTNGRTGMWHSTPVRAITYADFVALMRPGSHNEPERQMQRLRQVPMLFVDDLGVSKGSDYVEEVTYRLINGRYEDMLPSIFTTNLPPNQLAATLGDRLASRLIETCTQVVLTGADRRRVSA